MVAPVESLSLAAVLDRFEADLEAFTSLELYQATPTELTAGLARMETLLRQAASAQRRVVAEIDQRRVAGDYGVSCTASLVSQLLLISPAEAGARVRQARELCPRVALTGEMLPPQFPRVAQVLDAGAITLAHAQIITRMLHALPDHIDYEHGATAQRLLVESACLLNPTQLGSFATQLRDTLDPDGAETRENDQQRRRDFRLIVNPDGSSSPCGHFTPELTTVIRPVLDSLSAPAPAGDGMTDDRSAGQRRHDAILDAAHRLLRSATLPDSGGCPVTVLLTITADPATGTPQARDGYGTPVSIGTALRLAAEAEICTVTLTTTGGILDYGTTRRLASVTQRRALAARDKGCSHPGCTRPAAWTEAHHIIEWRHGGPTDLSNLVLVCSYHHRHFQSAGWAVRMGQDGVPDWVPPAWLDPDQKPRRNTAHQLPAITLDPPEPE